RDHHMFSNVGQIHHFRVVTPIRHGTQIKLIAILFAYRRTVQKLFMHQSPSRDITRRGARVLTVVALSGPCGRATLFWPREARDACPQSDSGRQNLRFRNKHWRKCQVHYHRQSGHC
ncbi:hypothetical protein ACDY97_30085, partial [Rhizobium mongolense]